jgi:hypothetical protein
MLRTFAWVLTGLLLATSIAAADGTYTIKTAATPIPKELKEPVARLLGERSVQLVDDKGALVCELWFRKEVPAKASAEQLKNGLTYRELEETTLVGAMRVDQLMRDYKNQKVKPAVYTLRLAFQPMDGDHMGTAPYPEFLLTTPAALDVKPEPMEPKELHERSSKTGAGSHPGVFLLYPSSPPEETPKLVNKEGKWVLNLQTEATAAGMKGPLGVGLTLVGHSE